MINRNSDFSLRIQRNKILNFNYLTRSRFYFLFSFFSDTPNVTSGRITYVKTININTWNIGTKNIRASERYIVCSCRVGHELSWQWIYPSVARSCMLRSSSSCSESLVSVPIRFPGAPPPPSPLRQLPPCPPLPPLPPRFLSCRFLALAISAACRFRHLVRRFWNHTWNKKKKWFQLLYTWFYFLLTHLF